MTVKRKWKWLPKAAELYITKLKVALCVVCLGCEGTIKGHQGKRKKFKDNFYWSGVEDMADLLCENFVVVINNSLDILATCMSIKVLAIWPNKHAI